MTRRKRPFTVPKTVDGATLKVSIKTISKKEAEKLLTEKIAALAD